MTNIVHEILFIFNITFSELGPHFSQLAAPPSLKVTVPNRTAYHGLIYSQKSGWDLEGLLRNKYSNKPCSPEKKKKKPKLTCFLKCAGRFCMHRC